MRPSVYWRYLRRDWNRNGWEPTDTGWLLSILLLALVMRVALPNHCDGQECASKLDEFLELPPSEMGDTFAGLFSALAFVWIIVTVFMQSKELREQRKEIAQQRQATQKMAKSMALQASIFQDEKKQRDENRARELLDEHLQSLRAWTLSETIKNNKWDVLRNHKGRKSRGSKELIDRLTASSIPLFLATKGITQKSEAEFFQQQYDHLAMLNKLLPSFEEPEMIENSPSASIILDSQASVGQIIGIFDRLSEAQKERFKNMALFGIADQLQRLSSEPIWSDLKSKGDERN